MANYVYIENGTIEEYYDILPDSWRHISGLNLLSKQELLNYGWYSVRNMPETHDWTTSYVAGYTYEIFDDHVKQIPQIVNYDQEKIDQIQQEMRDSFFNTLREERNRKLQQCDWTQLLDIQKTKSIEWITVWETYRQTLRDIPQQYENTTIYNMSIVEWPVEPTMN